MWGRSVGKVKEKHRSPGVVLELGTCRDLFLGQKGNLLM